MKIVILADSLAMPRQPSEGDIPDEATYPFLLDQSLRWKFGSRAPIVVERGMRRRTIEYVLDDWFELVELKAPKILIIHVGIVDCAPRIFLRRERQFVERLRPRFLRETILRFVHKHRRAIIKLRPRVYVPAKRFRRHVEKVVERAQASNIQSLVFINILKPPVEMEVRSPGFIHNVETYNQIFSDCVRGEGLRVIDLNQVIDAGGGAAKLTVDGIHINQTGHALLAGELEAHIMKLLPEETAAGFVTTAPVGGVS